MQNHLPIHYRDQSKEPRGFGFVIVSSSLAAGFVLAAGFRALAYADGGALRWDLSSDYLLPAAAMLALVAVLGRRKPDDA